MKNRPPKDSRSGFGKRPDRPRRDGDKKPWADKPRGEKRDGKEARPARARTDETRSDRPRSNGEKKPWSDKPKRDGEKKPWSDKPRGEKREYSSDRPKRDGEKKPWSDKPKREYSSDRPARPLRDDARSDRPRRDGERKPWADKPKREYSSDRPKRDGEKKPWADKPRGEKRDFNSDRPTRHPREDAPSDRPRSKEGRPERPQRYDHNLVPKTRATAFVSRHTTDLNGPLRIAKRIAEAGVCSRRDAERLIEEGRVTLNGKRVTTPAINVTAEDRIEVNGKSIPVRATETRLFLYHKPRGELVTERDPQGRPTIFDNLPKDLPRLLSVGRLDMDSEGLLLLTTSGGLARELELPATGHARSYRVRIFGLITDAHIALLKKGITVEGVTYGSIDVREETPALSTATAGAEQVRGRGELRSKRGAPPLFAESEPKGRNRWLIVTLHEGKNREIRRVFDHLGYPVNRLVRLSYGPFTLDKLPQGTLMEIKPKDWQKALSSSRAGTRGGPRARPRSEGGEA